MQTQEHIHVNSYGEFDQGCICGASDFYTVRNNSGEWYEIEPTIIWHGWGCINCFRVFNDKGEVVAHPETIAWLS